MTVTALLILAVQTALGALDNVLHHELTERLATLPSARHELMLHSMREAIYGVLFLIFAWSEPSGAFAAVILTLLLTEVAITIADFIEEDRTRHLPPFERVLHTVLAVLYGAFLAFAVPWLIEQTLKPSALAFVSHGLLSWFFTLASIGVVAFAVRNAIAVRRLAKYRPLQGIAQSPASGRNVLVTGATGFIGRALVERLIARGDRVFVLTRDTRRAAALFGANAHYVEALAALPRETRVDAVVNLAGAPIIGLPWTPARRSEIWRSRVELTDTLVRWLGTLERKPKVLVSGSAVGVYGDRADEVLQEESVAGEGFAADLCHGWEKAAFAASIRTVCLRIGLVLDRSGGPLPMMALPVRLGFASILGDGAQWMSWITRDDLVRMIVTAIDDDRWRGPINAVAPEPTRHVDFQRALARTLHRPLLLRAPAWILRSLLGEMSTIFLYSQRVVPAQASALGFAFDVHWVADALALQLGPPPAALPKVQVRRRPVLKTVAATDDHARPAPVEPVGADEPERKRARP